MKITIEETKLQVQASFRPRHAMGEFQIYFFDKLEWCNLTYGVGEGFFRLTLWEYSEESGGSENAALTIQWEAETELEKNYFNGEMFTSEGKHKDSLSILFVPYRGKISNEDFVCVRVNMEKPQTGNM